MDFIASIDTVDEEQRKLGTKVFPEDYSEGTTANCVHPRRGVTDNVKIKEHGSLGQTRSSTPQEHQNPTAQEPANAQRKQFKGKLKASLPLLQK